MKKRTLSLVPASNQVLPELNVLSSEKKRKTKKTNSMPFYFNSASSLQRIFKSLSWTNMTSFKADFMIKRFAKKKKRFNSLILSVFNLSLYKKKALQVSK